MIVAELIEMLGKADPLAVVWAVKEQAFSIDVVVQTTTGDPATGRRGGDPSGSSAILLLDRRTYAEREKLRKQYPVVNDVTKIIGTVST